ncbi:MAG: CoA transferase subunit A [Lentimicrobiaceae bacterium]|nr:CoA transferase subunit A [Lentimicrobiaceae bacterium]
MAKIISLEEAVNQIDSGTTIMIGGFLGNGSPKKIIDLLVQKQVKELTLIANDSATPEIGLGKLIANRQVKKIITSYIGMNPTSIELMNAGEMEVEFVPQGTLAERVRCGGAGLGGVLTKTGVGTLVAKDKQHIVVGGVEYLLELPLRADIALIGATLGDKSGNLQYKGTTQNFNPLMATAADLVIAEVENLVEIGDIAPELVHTPATFVDFMVVNE